MKPRDNLNSGSKQNRVREALGRLYEEHPPYFREYLRRYEEDPTSRVFAPLAEAYRKLGRLEEAIQICRDGLNHHPEFHGGRVALAKCLMEKGDMGGARVELERVIRVAPENLLAQKLMGEVAKALGDGATALHAYKMALLLAPNDVSLSEKVHQLEHSSALFLHAGGISPDGGAPIEPVFPNSKPPGDELQPAEKSAVEDSPLEESFTKGNMREHTAFGEVGGDARLGTVSALPIHSLLGEDESVDDIDDEGFKIEHISAVFDEDAQRRKGITTETLGDLYFSQGQYERALRIYERLPLTPELGRKVRDCKLQLGVDENQLQRSRQVALLRKVLKSAQSANKKR